MTAEIPSIQANRFHEIWEDPSHPFDLACDALLEPVIHEGVLERVHATSYGEMIEGSARIASHLTSNGVQIGDAVVLLMEPGRDLYQSIMGVLRAGARSIFVNPADGTRHVDRCVDRVSARAFIGSSRAHLLRLVCPALRRIPLYLHTGNGAVPGSTSLDAARDAGHPGFGTRPVGREDPAIISFTTGSTGDPKAVQRTHGDLRRTYDVLKQHPGKTHQGVNFLAFPNLPLDDLTAGRTAMMAPLLRGRVLDSPFGAFLDMMEKHPPRIISFPPILLERVMERARAENRSFSSVKTLFVGGGVAPVDLMRRYPQTFPESTMTVIFGSTEVEPICHLDIPDAASPAFESMLRARAQGQGILIGSPAIVEARTIRPHRGPLEVVESTEGRGELVVTGPHVPVSYHQNPEQTALFKIRDADGRIWHRTGDLAHMDPEGRIWFHGRMSHGIKGAHGETIQPLDVEAMVDNLNGIRRSALSEISLGGLSHQDLDRDRSENVLVLAVETASVETASDRSPSVETASVETASDRAASGEPSWNEVVSRIRALDLPGGLSNMSILQVDAIPMDARAGAKIDYAKLQTMLVPTLRKQGCAPFGRRLDSYLRARFPVGETLVGALVYVTGIMGSIGHGAWRTPLDSLLTLTVVFGFFFHMRGFDEAKDHEIDKIVYPDRPVPRGLITLGEIAALTRGAIIVEAIAAALLGGIPFLYWMLALGYSCLMRAEFFARDWLRQHIFWYGISHVSVVFLLSQFVCHAVRPDIGVVWAGGVISLTIAWYGEIGRKLRMPKAEEHLHDPTLEESYIRELGASRTALLLGGITLVGLVAGLLAGRDLGRGVAYAVGLVTVGLIVLGATLKFARQPSGTTGKKAHKASMLWALVQYGMLALGPLFLETPP